MGDSTIFFQFYRLHLAIQAYKELLFNVSCMIKSDLKDLRNHAKIIQGKLDVSGC